MWWTWVRMEQSIHFLGVDRPLWNSNRPRRITVKWGWSTAVWIYRASDRWLKRCAVYVAECRTWWLVMTMKTKSNGFCQFFAVLNKVNLERAFATAHSHATNIMDRTSPWCQLFLSLILCTILFMQQDIHSVTIEGSSGIDGCGSAFDRRTCERMTGCDWLSFYQLCVWMHWMRTRRMYKIRRRCEDEHMNRRIHDTTLGAGRVRATESFARDPLLYFPLLTFSIHNP